MAMDGLSHFPRPGKRAKGLRRRLRAGSRGVGGMVWPGIKGCPRDWAAEKIAAQSRRPLPPPSPRVQIAPGREWRVLLDANGDISGTALAPRPSGWAGWSGSCL